MDTSPLACTDTDPADPDDAPADPANGAAAERRKKARKPVALPPPGWLATSVDAFAELIGGGRNLVYNEIKEGRLRARRCGRRTFIVRPDAEAWLSSLEEGTAELPASIRQQREERRRHATVNASTAIPADRAGDKDRQPTGDASRKIACRALERRREQRPAAE